MQRTLVLLKPDAVARGLVGVILGRFEAKGLSICGMKMMQVERELAELHYQEHKGKPFYAGLVNFITAGPVIAVCLEGKDAVAVVRRAVGATNSAEADPGSIRGDMAMSNRFNLVHASDSPASAKRELDNFFTAGELRKVGLDSLRWVYDLSEGEPI